MRKISGRNGGTLHLLEKGETANPKGRVKKLPDLDVLLSDVLGIAEDGKSAAHDILVALYKKAKRGDVRAAELLLERAYGKPKQPIEHSGEIKGFKIMPASDKRAGGK